VANREAINKTLEETSPATVLAEPSGSSIISVLSSHSNFLEVKVSNSSSDSSPSPTQLNESQNSCIVDEFENHYKESLADEEETRTSGCNVTVIENAGFQPQRHRSSSFNCEQEAAELAVVEQSLADELFERPVARLDFVETDLVVVEEEQQQQHRDG
jgi:hypothetical protein